MQTSLATFERDCRALREAGWTQEAIANELGVSRTTVRRALMTGRIITMDPHDMDNLDPAKVRAVL